MKNARYCLGLWSVAMAVAAARAHGAGDESGALPGWTWEPWPVFGLLAIALLYARGARHSPRRSPRRILCFGLGWATLVVALLSPIHALGGIWFSVHMVQHELLMVVAAPLLAMGQPDTALAFAFPRQVTRRAAITLRRLGRHWWPHAASPLGATLLHAVALWLWHLPPWFEAGLRNDFIHGLQHVSFLATAVLFWRAMLRGPRRSLPGLAILYLFLTATHSGALGALLTFATRLWYPSYAHAATNGSLSSLEDQQLGGLIMWVPAGLIYAVAALLLAAYWLRRSDEPCSPATAGLKPSPACAPAR